MLFRIMKFIASLLIFLTIATFSSAEFKPLTKKEFLDRNLKALEKRFNQIDTNKDQKIDAKENEAWRKKVLEARKKRLAQIQKQRQELRKKIDINKDGKLSKKEIEDFKKKTKK